MFCTACSTANPPAAAACGGCGAALEGVGTGRGAAAGRPAAAPRRGWRRMLGRAGALNLALIILLPLAGTAISGGYLWAERGERVAAYNRGVALLRAGDPESALLALTDAGGHADAESLRSGTVSALAPVQPLYLAALDAIARGDLEEAVAALIPVVVAFPSYRDAAALLDQARAAESTRLRTEVDDAIDAGDWLAAERGLAQLAANDPGDITLTRELATIRQDHAPILFGWNGRLLTVGPDGRDQRIVLDDVQVAWPVWSPDRTQIAFTSPEDGGGRLTLYVVNADGSEMRRLGESLRPYEPPVWSPDGTKIAYLSTAGLPEPEEAALITIDPNFAAYFGSSIYFDLQNDTGDSTPERTAGQTGQSGQVTVGSGSAHPWEWVPPPSLPAPLAVYGPTLHVADVATGRILAPLHGRVMATTSPTWAPGSDRIAFVSRPSEEQDQRLTGLPAGEVYVVDLRTGALGAPAPSLVPDPWRVAWSPAAGAETLVVWSRGPGDAYDAGPSPLTLVDVRTGKVSNLNPYLEKVTMPVWSPDGGRIAYIQNDFTLMVRQVSGISGTPGVPGGAPRSGEVVGDPAAGGDWSVLLPEAPAEFLTWSPDGTALLAAGGGHPSQIVHLTGDRAGTAEPFLLIYDTNRRQGSPPQWSPLAPAPGPRPASVGGTAWDG